MIGRRAIGLVLSVLLIAGTARAQTFTPDPVDAEAARREGALSWQGQLVAFRPVGFDKMSSS